MKKSITVKARYERYKSNRQVFLDRARKCSELTIPTLIPPEGKNATTVYYTPWQGVGARGVNNLASKLLLSLLPPNSPFFKMVVDEYTKDKLAGDPKFKSKVDEGLGKYERAVQDDIEQSGYRSPVFLIFKHMIIGGNIFVYLPPGEGIRLYPLDSFVCSRDPMGNVLEAITVERVSEETLDDSILELIKKDAKVQVIEEDKDKTDKSVEDILEVYTRFWRTAKTWRTVQEINGIEVPGSRGSWPIDKPPFMALRWSAVECEDYGRSYVEEYIGDLIALEGLSKAIVETAAIAAKAVFLVSPNGVTKAKDLTKAENGDTVIGSKDDVHCLQTEKQADLSIAYEAVKTISERLSYAFLMSSAVQRNGERVTAEEIRYMASELEDALGGVYSILAHEFQLPFVTRIIDRLTKAKKLPPLPKGMVKPTIITGLEALGRGHDVNKLSLFLTKIIQPLGPEGMRYLNISELIARGANGIGIDPVGLVRSDDEVRQEAAAQAQQAKQAMGQQQMADLAGKAAPSVIKAMSDHAMSNGASAQQPQQ